MIEEGKDRASALEFVETLEPMLFPPAFHFLHVVPAGMAGESKKIEMGLGNIDAAFQRSNAVAIGIMIVNITKQYLGAIRHWILISSLL